MSSGVNHCTFIGNLGRDPEVNTTTGGKKVCKFSIGVNEGKDKVTWVDIVAWEKLAETCATYLKKGRQVFVAGRYSIRSWDDKETGKKVYRSEIVANHVTFLGGGDGERASGGGTRKPVSSMPPEPSADDDIPF